MSEGAGPWRPIETVPRDGTEVLLTDGQHRTCGYWSANERDPERDPDTGLVFDWLLRQRVTHWAPLPAPPASTETGDD